VIKKFKIKLIIKFKKSKTSNITNIYKNIENLLIEKRNINNIYFFKKIKVLIFQYKYVKI
jgi:hypothetical protein